MLRMNPLIVFLAILSLASCDPVKPDDKGNTGGPGEQKALSLTDFARLNQSEGELNSHSDGWDRSVLKMDYSSLVEVTNNVQYPHYPRLRTLPDGSYILFWQTSSVSDANGKDTHYALSKDLKNWTYMGNLWKSYNVVTSIGTNDVRYFTNANGLVLSSGELLVVAAFRAVHAYGKFDAQADQGLIVKKSKDGGKTWYGETEIYHGPCWEAHLIELPSGEIQCFYSESRPWISSSHSGTGMVWSKDGGATWEPELGSHFRVMRKHWWNFKPSNTSYGSMYCYTYQMPVGVILNGSKQFAFAMESANQRVANSSGGTNDQFSIALAFSKEDGVWENLVDDEVLPPEQRIDSLVPRGAAPYLVQFRSGECLLAYGGTDGKQHLMLGGPDARQWGAAFDGLPYKGSWGGFDLTSSHQVISYMRDSRISAEEACIQIARFNLDHDIKASGHTVKIDADNSDWSVADDALFVGSKGNARATLRCSADAENLYFLVEVFDEKLSRSDFCTLYLCNGDKFGGSSRRIKVYLDGLKGVSNFAGSWKEISDSKVNAKSAYDGNPASLDDTDNGYLAEICVPRSELPISGGEILVNFSIFDAAANSEDSVKDTNSPAGWLKIKGL